MRGNVEIGVGECRGRCGERYGGVEKCVGELQGLGQRRAFIEIIRFTVWIYRLPISLL